MQTENKSLLINHLAHDINNILTRILNSVELLKKKISNYNEVSALLNNIENGTHIISELIEDTVWESKNKTPRKKRINLNTLINDLVNSFIVHLKDRINFILKLDQNLYPIEGKYIDFYRVLLNLITNAVESIKETGTITISTTNLESKFINEDELKLFNNQSFIQIKIADSGTGIESSVIPFIFDENFSTKGKSKNRGFGLTIVNNIIKNYNGSIKLKSEINKGTEFCITLPAIKIKTLKNNKEKKTILIAEDEIILQELLTELLESYNYDVITVSNGNEVITQLNSRTIPDILIIDQNMPDMDGILCIKKVKELYQDLPVILATGSQSNFMDDPELNQIINRIITKPYNIEELVSIIKELLD
ncbi:ATP-binding response regulator [Rosettibacter firmus]|uniref:ATP-binding response regulator n=1 Tax=Rosettibacter firmus TaxID=3111522 RepID=UPI00336BC930